MASRPMTHQTVRIKRGAHTDPGDGACVMELASMLAGERFSDRPLAVCPIIAGFLRTYNDTLDDDRRQDLVPLASAVVGTATSDEDVVAARVHLIAEWGRAQQAGRRRRRLPFGRRAPLVDESQGREVGIRAVRSVRRIDGAMHASALALVERLIATDPGRSATGPAAHVPDGVVVTAGS